MHAELIGSHFSRKPFSFLYADVGHASFRCKHDGLLLVPSRLYAAAILMALYYDYADDAKVYFDDTP